MSKVFVQCDVVRNNALKLAARIYNDGFIPDVIYVSLRGGAYVGNVISEFFKLKSGQHDLKPVLYSAVVARSYEEPGSQKIKICIDGWTYDPKYLRNGDRVLLVDDIYDTGNTINYLADVIIQNGIKSEHLKIVVHDYKVHTYMDTQATGTPPNYYYRKITVNKPSESEWIHYLSHELVGLTDAEIRAHYPEEIQSILIDPNSK